MHRNATMADVARLAGVGTMTVSRLLTGSARVSPEATERIYAAISKLNYKPNEVARSLRGLRSKTIGVIVPYLYDPFFATCAHEIATVAKQHGYSVIVTTSNENPDTEDHEASLMVRRNVEGLLVIPVTTAHSRLERSEFSKTPIVTLDRPGSSPRFDSVMVHNRSGVKLAIDHLLEHQHKRIAFLGLSKDLYTMKARYAGYRQAMMNANLEADSYIDCISQAETVPILQGLLAGKQPPTAIFAANNLSMLYALLALDELGVDVPREIALAGFDDFETAEIIRPTLTVIRQPTAEMGRVAANLLFDRLLRGEFPERGSRIVLPVELVVRRSCGCKLKTTRVTH